ncbi:hypothetical protein D4S03_00715 [bacterium]|nr:MAG: hypothetical protein D4S03_00715 [bacterium]
MIKKVPFPIFDRKRLKLEPLAARKHDLQLSDILPLNRVHSSCKEIQAVAHEILSAKKKNASIVLMMGAHVIRSGVQRFIIDLMQRGYLSCIAMNGAGVIHDFEFALTGATTESVAEYIREGYFGLWRETGRINDIVSEAAEKEMGLGESIGKAIEEQNLPYREISLFAAGYRLGIPMTVHVGIGYDIVHEHPNCNGSAYGATSYTDFLRFAKVLEKLEGGVVMNFGSAVMAPEVYLKALAMVRNVARQQGTNISKFTTLVCDLLDLPENYREEAPRDDISYYYRPWKTMLIRTVADGGKSHYVKGVHSETIPQLWSSISEAEESKLPCSNG